MATASVHQMTENLFSPEFREKDESSDKKRWFECYKKLNFHHTPIFVPELITFDEMANAIRYRFPIMIYLNWSN